MTQVSPNPSPRLSVCIPTYRGEAHLKAAIDSVLAQDFTEYELIILDDHSPDRTSELVASYRDARIRYLSNETNLGPEGNWNRCLAEARGKYFKLLPQDDVLNPGCLGRQIEVLEQDEEESIALVFCARHIIDHSGKVITTRGYPGRHSGVIPAVDLFRNCIRRGTNLLGEPGAVMFRKALADEVGPFDGSISYIIDLDYWFRLLSHGNGYYIHLPLASFRVASGSWSVAIGNKQSGDFIRFIDRCTQTYPISGRDATLGRLMARFNNVLRLAFYKFVIGFDQFYAKRNTL